VLHADVSELERVRHVPPSGANLAIFDLFDEVLLGSGCLTLLKRVHQQVLQPGAAVVPAGATVYCLGLEILTREVLGFDMTSLNQFRFVEEIIVSQSSCSIVY
jgi:protein arginine N-methyltransferase 7